MTWACGQLQVVDLAKEDRVSDSSWLTKLSDLVIPAFGSSWLYWRQHTD